MVNTVKYDREQVIQKATHLFWEKGFHATSMRNIQECIDMRPGSIYACFGSKEGLFKETLNFYTNTMLERLEGFKVGHSSPLVALKEFIFTSALDCKQNRPNEMCMLVKTISELNSENTELLEEARKLMKVMENAFANLLLQAQQQGELENQQDANRLARFLQMQLIGVRSYSRVNNQAEIKDLIEDAFSCLN
ncbi:TetR/AcrR family transcriptional regulator [Neptuniibacter sp. PT8_73]|uniref:TetR/AcrR family transcriptional regulator n=1 Tax=Neptuniibacter sp. PT8_73 TaxID=3398206 RepID=UPI0039F633BE